MGYDKNYLFIIFVNMMILFYGSTLGQLPPGGMEQIDAFMEDILECSGIPGMALAAVKEGQVVISKGYGKANLEQGINVDEHTKFNIASVTKHFTGTLVARLLNMSDSFTWDTPVRDIIGDWFHMYNGYYSNHTTLRDLLAMKTGVPRNDLLWSFDIFDRTEMAERVRFLSPIYPFRSKFLYNNVMYGVAGVAAEGLGGASWEDLITDLLFEPIGMSSSTFINRAPDNYEGYATPYLLDSDDDIMLPVPIGAYQGFRSTGPAGSIASSAHDMSKWILFWLNEATTGNGTKLLTQKELTEFLAPENILIGTPPFSEQPNFPVLFALYEKYAKGFCTGFYRDYQTLVHEGGMRGYYSIIFLLPDKGVGSFLSVNAPEYGMKDYILAFVNDILLEEEVWITSDEVCNLLPQLKEEYKTTDGPDQYTLKDTLETNDINLSDSRTMDDLEEYTGSYGNFAYGNATVILNQETESLEMEIGNTGIFDLLPTVLDNVFVAKGKQSPASLYYSGPVMFSRSEGDVVDTLDMPNSEPSYLFVIRFIRGRKLSDAPPPDIHGCE